jgi:hypothetical protein
MKAKRRRDDMKISCLSEAEVVLKKVSTSHHVGLAHGKHPDLHSQIQASGSNRWIFVEMSNKRFGQSIFQEQCCIFLKSGMRKPWLTELISLARSDLHPVIDKSPL